MAYLTAFINHLTKISRRSLIRRHCEVSGEMYMNNKKFYILFCLVCRLSCAATVLLVTVSWL